MISVFIAFAFEASAAASFETANLPIPEDARCTPHSVHANTASAPKHPSVSTHIESTLAALLTNSQTCSSASHSVFLPYSQANVHAKRLLGNWSRRIGDDGAFFFGRILSVMRGDLDDCFHPPAHSTTASNPTG